MQLPSPSSLSQTFPLSTTSYNTVQKHRKEIANLIQGKDLRFVIITGPCSLHNQDSALAYAKKLLNLQSHVEKTCKLVMRAHFEKPRTYLGWKGILHDPFLDGRENILQGLAFSRDLLLQLADTGIALAAEFLDPIASCYFSDLISWGFIGARTSTSQIHRQLASHLAMPVGFKNSPDGDITSALHGALFARHSHSLLQIDQEAKACFVKSLGNPSTHIVLRGANAHANYEPHHVDFAIDICQKNDFSHRILVDCSHGNSQKHFSKQKKVLLSILDQYRSGNSQLLGVMLESHLKEGSQDPSSFASPSVSVTDPCIGWEQTEELILSVHESLSLALCSS